MFQVSLTSDQSFRIDGSSSILDAAVLSGVGFPYSCKTGQCGACKCRLVEGETLKLQPELALSEQEIRDGWILSCARTAASDIRIETDTLIDVPLPQPKLYPCRIKNIENLSPDIIKVSLRLPPSAAFVYFPGQYIDVIGPEGSSRSYSIASTQLKQNAFDLHIRKVPGGVMSEYWFTHAKVNDLLRFKGPLGTFLLGSVFNQDLYFVATGTGIAPVLALLGEVSALDEARKPKSVTVIWGARTSGDLYLSAGDFEQSLTYLPVLSRAGEQWQGCRGYVQDVLLQQNPNLCNARVYACGSSGMINAVRLSLFSAGLNENAFFSDAFVCSST